MKTREIIVALIAIADFILGYLLYDCGEILYAMNTLVFFVGGFILYSMILCVMNIGGES